MVVHKGMEYTEGMYSSYQADIIFAIFSPRMHRCIERNICITKMRNNRKVRNKHSVLIHWIPQQFPIADFCLCPPACIPLSTIICPTCVRLAFWPKMSHFGTVLTPLGAFFRQVLRPGQSSCMYSIEYHHLFDVCKPFGASLASNVIFLAQNLPFWDRFDTAGCTFLTSFATRVVLLN